MELQCATLCFSESCSHEHEVLCGRQATKYATGAGRDTTIPHDFARMNSAADVGGGDCQGQGFRGNKVNEPRNGDSFDEIPNGYDVVTFVVNERRPSLEKKTFRDHERSSESRVRDHTRSLEKKTAHDNREISLEKKMARDRQRSVEKQPERRCQSSPGGKRHPQITSPPSTRSTAARRRLHQTLVTSQRAWSSKHQPQQAPTTNYIRSFSPPNNSVVVATPSGDSLRGLCLGVSRPDPVHPATEPPPRWSENDGVSSYAPAARPASAEHGRPTANSEALLGLSPPANRRETPTGDGAWGVAASGGGVVGAGRVSVDLGVTARRWELDNSMIRAERDSMTRESTAQSLELDYSRKEASSAKRKASQYKACMLEAQVGLDKKKKTAFRIFIAL